MWEVPSTEVITELRPPPSISLQQHDHDQEKEKAQHRSARHHLSLLSREREVEVVPGRTQRRYSSIIMLYRHIRNRKAEEGNGEFTAAKM